MTQAYKLEPDESLKRKRIRCLLSNTYSGARQLPQCQVVDGNTEGKCPRASVKE